MALGIYKPGQGYWMRVLTAAVVGTVFLALAMWAASQAERIVAALPVSTYAVGVRATATGTPPASGTRVTILGQPQSSAPAPVIGTAVVNAYDPDNRLFTLKGVEVSNTNYQATDASRIVVESAAGSAPTYAADVIDTRARPPVEPVLVQGIVASIILILGAIVTYWFCAIRPRSVDFLINTDMEMKKVNWSTRKDIIGSTWVVIGSSFIIAAFIFIADFLMQFVFKSIGVLQT
jgi:preprotein translocase SecE subunit